MVSCRRQGYPCSNKTHAQLPHLKARFWGCATRSWLEDQCGLGGPRHVARRLTPAAPCHWRAGAGCCRAGGTRLPRWSAAGRWCILRLGSIVLLRAREGRGALQALHARARGALVHKGAVAGHAPIAWGHRQRRCLALGGGERLLLGGMVLRRGIRQPGGALALRVEARLAGSLGCRGCGFIALLLADVRRGPRKRAIVVNVLQLDSRAAASRLPAPAPAAAAVRPAPAAAGGPLLAGACCAWCRYIDLKLLLGLLHALVYVTLAVLHRRCSEQHRRAGSLLLLLLLLQVW